MNEKEVFSQLLLRYYNNTISPQEHEELKQLIKKGDYDIDLKDHIDKFLNENAGEIDMEIEKAHRILSYIIKTGRENHKDEIKWNLYKKYPYWVGAAAATILIVMIVTGGLVFTGNRAEKIVSSDFYEMKQQVPKSFSGKQFVKLPDGSTVVLNENSELSYDTTFGDKVREVRLTGEGYFDIQHNTSKPFLVHTQDGLTVTVMGTAFNVRAYPSDEEVKVTVTRGKVRVGREEHVYGIITPDEQIVVNTVTHEFSQGNIDAMSEISWKSQYLILDNLSMEEAMQQIAERYNVHISFTDKNIKKYRITATFLNGESLEHILTVVCGVVDATYSIDDQGNISINEKQ